MKNIIFTLAEARSGTLYLRNLFRNNVVDCASRHETFFDWRNPHMFGRAIFDAHARRFEKIRARLQKKKDYIDKLPGSIYIETSHAFLKSSYLAALEFFPEMKLVHLVRDPFQVAASQAYRESWRRRMHVPFHYYYGDDGQYHFLWALTGNEKIFENFDQSKLSLFQWYVIQWIEVENRAMQFLDKNGLHDRCLTLHSPTDLNNPDKVREMFDFLEVQTRQSEIIFGGRKNQSLGYSPEQMLGDEKQFQTVIQRLPKKHLEIFEREPYSNFDWIRRFKVAKTPAAAKNRPVEPVSAQRNGNIEHSSMASR